MHLKIPIALRWGDLDAYGHINNVEILRLIEEARVRSFWSGDSALALDAASDIWSLVSHTEIEYLMPMPYSAAPIDIEVWLGRLGGASIQVCFELYSPAGVLPRVLFARAVTTIVTVDAASGRPTRIPPQLRTRWAPYQEEPATFRRR